MCELSEEEIGDTIEVLGRVIDLIDSMGYTSDSKEKLIRDACLYQMGYLDMLRG